MTNKRHYVVVTPEPLKNRYTIKCHTCDWSAKPKSSRESAMRSARRHEDLDA